MSGSVHCSRRCRTFPRQMTLEADRALLDAFRKGDKRALARVFDLYVDDVAHTVRTGVVVDTETTRVRVGNDLQEADVEAIIQETFARAFAPKARESYDGIRPYGAYLAQIARNLIIDRGRKLAREQTVRSLDVDALTVEEDRPNPEDVTAARELAGLVERFSSALEEPDKSVFRLRLAEGKSHRETGVQTGLTEMQVRRRDAQLKQAFLTFLRSHGFLRNASAAIGSSLLSRRGDE
jgi:RNA polymerase sigma factor (sigma-70 family)